MSIDSTGHTKRNDRPTSDFLKSLENLINDHLADEGFGVSELANAANMSRSNLLRKIKSQTGLSASQFIREERLKRGMEKLQQTDLNVSEVAYEVGFSSTSYFIKCFREYYGYPPGQVGNVEVEPEATNEDEPKPVNSSGRTRFYILVSIVVLGVMLTFIYSQFFKGSNPPVLSPALEKSIAVLPFKNDSDDSTNVHIVNGLMESVLNNLQKIEDLRVISRTSIEKYRHSDKTIPEIAEELQVSYLIEGSGQKIGDQILLNIQLVEATTDNHLWAEQYERETTDIFNLQRDVAKQIASEIKVIIKPEEEAQINQIPTDNLEAYEHFLKGMDAFYAGTQEGLEEAIVHFKQAIEKDEKFARAYANIAITYYYLDIFKLEKDYTDDINQYSDKALLFDARLPQAMIAKAFYYMNTREYALAVPHLEKALEYHPNSSLVINTLSDLYANYIPDNRKYLEYALKGVGVDVVPQDSLSASFTYLHLSNALIQFGFVDEALKYIDQSLVYNPDNLFSAYLRAYILLAQGESAEITRERLIAALKKDTTRLDIVQEIGKMCYSMRDYELGYAYYKGFLDVKRTLNLDIFPAEDIKIAYVFLKNGQLDEAEKLINDFKAFAEADDSDFRHLNLAAYYAYRDDQKKVVEHLEAYVSENHYYYWIVRFLPDDPLMDEVKDDPEFKEAMSRLESGFWEHHEQLKARLIRKGLI
ncbi:MAG: helix-turn-helix domain-containing protein [Bacteroidota bacterium]